MDILEQIRKQVQKDPAFSAALKEAKNAEEVRKVLLAAGFQVSLADVLAMASADFGALSDEQLESVSGGSIRPPLVEWPFW